MYQLKITLEESDPAIWRRIAVLKEVPLEDLNHIIQTAMGWTNSHLHIFSAVGNFYSDPEFGFESDIEDETYVRLCDLVRDSGDAIQYEYDMGDAWMHRVEVEEVLTDSPVLIRFCKQMGTSQWALCLAGERRCPPEDIGGVPGFEEFLTAISDPDHLEHEEYLVWIGGSFDPDEFNIDRVNRRLRKIQY